MSRPETFEAESREQSPIRQAAIEAYSVGSRNLIDCNPMNKQMTDLDLDLFFKTDMSYDIYPANANKPEAKNAVLPSFEQGLQGLDKSSASLEDAIKSLDNGNSLGTIRDLEKSKRYLNQASNDITDGLRQQSGGDDALRAVENGVNSASLNNFAIDTSIELIKSGCPGEARQLITESLKRLNGSREEIDTGLDSISESKGEAGRSQVQDGPEGARADRVDGAKAEVDPPKIATRDATRNPVELSLSRDGVKSENGDRIVINPFDGREKPAVKPGDYLVVSVNIPTNGVTGLIDKVVNKLVPQEWIDKIPKADELLEKLPKLAEGLWDKLPKLKDTLKDVFDHPVESVKNLFKKVF
jgi:exonuclease VII small subunit